ncbi:hypothetical protein NDA07_17035 [Microcoleus vaginatus DQ-U2]|uniref:hypothetical protein n=1 Tax=Microcoleus vaginatus TaxID=119532 RepID=UPI0016856AD2|nr:hypothetical protein [Microcoleus sp. FACHB-DQ6]
MVKQILILPRFPLLNNTLSSPERQGFYRKKKGEFLIFYLINNLLDAGEKFTGTMARVNSINNSSNRVTAEN